MKPVETIPAEILGRFFAKDTLPPPGRLRIEPLGEGRINETFLVSGPLRQSLVIQRINEGVFPDPVGLARNVSRISAYLAAGGGTERFPRSIATDNGEVCAVDRDGGIWRAFEYVVRSKSYRTVTSPLQAYEVGRILGRFHGRLDGFDASILVEPLPGFHDLSVYCREFQKACDVYRGPGSALLTFCCDEAFERIGDATILDDALASGVVKPRIVHGDPKCDNVLFDNDTGRAVALIDLDTVFSGLLQFDLGDCLRSVCNPCGESGNQGVAAGFQPETCRMVLMGYRDSGTALPSAEQTLIFDGVRLLTYELAIRFLTDYLQGNRYFKTDAPEDNLHRAAVQFRYLDSIERQRDIIEALVDEVWEK